MPPGDRAAAVWDRLWTSLSPRGLLRGAVVLAPALVALWFARTATFPGHADFSYYYGLARQLVEGEGGTLPYTWTIRPQMEAPRPQASVSTGCPVRRC